MELFRKFTISLRTSFQFGILLDGLLVSPVSCYAIDKFIYMRLLKRSLCGNKGAKSLDNIPIFILKRSFFLEGCFILFHLNTSFKFRHGRSFIKIYAFFISLSNIFWVGKRGVQRPALELGSVHFSFLSASIILIFSSNESCFGRGSTTGADISRHRIIRFLIASALCSC